jgi:hypothetical protein
MGIDNLMFIPCIAGLHVKTNTVHWVTSIYVYCYVAPTCYGTYVPSSGSVFVLVSYLKSKTASGNVNCVICVLVLWWCSGLCFPTQNRTTPQNRHTDHTVHVTRGCLSFQVTHKDKDAPWGWHVGAETCRSRIAINMYWRNPVHSVGFYTYREWVELLIIQAEMKGINWISQLHCFNQSLLCL